MKNNLKKASLLFLGAILLSACSLSVPKKDTDMGAEDNNNIENVSPSVTESPTPTLTKDSSLESIESDLKNTTVLEEDFTNIK